MAVDDGVIITRVVLEIEQESEAYDVVARMPERYSVVVDAEAIKITAQTGFAASRAFATMAQMVTAHPQYEETPSAYAIEQCNVEDYPVFPWREMMLDLGNRFFDMDHIH